MTEKTIPPRNREEWGKIISNEIKHKFINFVLEMQISKAQKDIANGNSTQEKGIDMLYSLCEKYTIAVQPDLKQIFKTW